MNSAPGNLADHTARETALDVARSFIVQAPAGSGKTGLLTKRFLRLLACVAHPEEIVAITFTRKAAGEMRDRLLEALSGAAMDAAPGQAHEREIWELARQALSNDRRHGWGLLTSPTRLRLQTIDSLCADLARQAPLLSRFGDVPDVTEDAEPLYVEAARLTLEELDGESGFADDIACLLVHRDNNMNELQRLIVSMLQRRDQWSSLVADPDHARVQREGVEQALRGLVREALVRVESERPDFLADALPALARFAAVHNADKAFAEALGELEALPGTDPAALAAWKAIARFLLTSGNWRRPRGVNKNLGFPAESGAQDGEQKTLFREMKQGMQQLLQKLEPEEGFRLALEQLSHVPEPRYKDHEWRVVEALLAVLKLALAQLRVVFARRGEVDFIEIALQASEALGSEECPTELALKLDYQIKHLLVDEFQDTSRSQIQLFEKLTANWSQEPERTLFLVGDPMQSIYRFREADVGLFINAWDAQRLGEIPLHPLQLAVNFRSQKGIVAWVNKSFPCILPATSDQVRGAVVYAPSTANQPEEAGAAVHLRPFVDKDDETEATEVLAIVEQARKDHPDGTTAILVRSKAHLLAIVAALKQSGLADFTAVEIDQLATRPVVQDLLSITRALLHPADRVAWLAILRAPCCGFCLRDLQTLFGRSRSDRQNTVLALLQDEKRHELLTDDGRRRLNRVLPLLTAALQCRDRQSPRDWVEGTWIALGGPAVVSTAAELEDAEAFLKLLEDLSVAGRPLVAEDIAAKVSTLFALPHASADKRLQIMTMHKAKGLEFDTVILPGLGKKPRGDDRRLLYWLEQTALDGAQELVFGPIPGAWEDGNPIAKYISRLEAEKSQFENGRLLYVAATRAKRRLHLLGHVKPNRDGDLNPERASLLYQLWPVVKPNFLAAQANAAANAEGEGQAVAVDRPTLPVAQETTVFRRLESTWECPPPDQPLPGIEPDNVDARERLDFDWAGEVARMVGVVAHRLLQKIAERESVETEAIDAEGFSATAGYLLGREGLPRNGLDAAVRRVVEILRNTLADKRGRWILSGKHRNAQCEFPLTSVIDGRVQQLVIDRTFVDSDGVRWIIDYKTGRHEGGSKEEFLLREKQRYEAQLHRYTSAFSSLEDLPIRVGLYFPAFGGWISW